MIITAQEDVEGIQGVCVIENTLTLYRVMEKTGGHLSGFSLHRCQHATLLRLKLAHNNRRKETPRYQTDVCNTSFIPLEVKDSSFAVLNKSSQR